MNTTCNSPALLALLANPALSAVPFTMFPFDVVGDALGQVPKLSDEIGQVSDLRTEIASAVSMGNSYLGEVTTIGYLALVATIGVTGFFWVSTLVRLVSDKNSTMGVCNLIYAFYSFWL